MTFPKGLRFVPDFLPAEGISPLLGELGELQYMHDTFRGRPIKRGSTCFGAEYIATGRRIKPAAKFTDWLNALVREASPYCPADARFEQCIVTRYGPGAGIGWHTDANYFGDSIMGICLGGEGRLRFRPLGSTRATAEVTTTSGSLYLMQGAARWEYQHEIVPVHDERYSLTFRSLPSSFLTPPSPADPIPGFLVRRDVLTGVYASQLIRHIQENDFRWELDYSRRAQRYGYRYHYNTRRVSPLGPLPDWLQPLAQLVRANGWMGSLPDQATVQEYEPGAGIGDHIDDPLTFGKEIVTFSLLSPCAYRLVLPELGITRELIVEPGSAVVLTGEARSIWKHGIPARKSDEVTGIRIPRSRRLSITFRTVNPDRITC
jgi:alkylated DNA repair dioxygenase AlkB